MIWSSLSSFPSPRSEVTSIDDVIDSTDSARSSSEEPIELTEIYSEHILTETFSKYYLRLERHSMDGRGDVERNKCAVLGLLVGAQLIDQTTVSNAHRLDFSSVWHV